MAVVLPCRGAGGRSPGRQFVHLQHGEYIPAVTDDCHVVLVKASPELEAATGASHVAERILSPRFKLDRQVIRAWGDGS